MPRRNQPRRVANRTTAGDGRVLRPGGIHRIEPGPAGRREVDFAVRDVPASQAVKEYRCPGCDQVIVVGTAHVVAWPSDGGGADDRRHWHSSCWSARARRTVTRRWS